MRIALTGISGAGKDYFGKALINEGYYRVSFSDQLKMIGSQIFNWLERDYEPEVKEKPLDIITSTGEKINFTPREIWLKLNKLRDIENGLFIRKLEEEMKLLRVEDILITDIRTKEEYDWCVRNDFKTIRIVPLKEVIHKTNDFDKQLDDVKFMYEFENKFDGDTSEFLEFIETLENH
jgi:hypothetical protein